MLSNINRQNLSGQIILDSFSKFNDEIVVTLTANIPNNTGMEYINFYIQNKDIYELNKTQIREDIKDFMIIVYETEDELNKNTLSSN